MLWAITCYFNPSGYKSRPANYRSFRKHLTVPLLAVELSFNGSFELESGAADILVQLTGGDVLWQKERLLNLALRHLPNDCDIIAWVDCDILFSNAHWQQQAREALNTFALIQLFSERWHLARDARLDSSGWSPIESRRQAIGHALAGDGLKPEELAVGGSFLHGPLSTGLAWAARRPLLDSHGFYDVRIVGGGDAAMIWAALGRPDHSVISQSMTGRAVEHYLAWAEPFFTDVGGRVGYLPGHLFHLWHGSYEERRHKERQRDLTALGFNPFTDIALDGSGCWRWNSDKPDLHKYVRNYFTARNEDGRVRHDGITP
jgi:hypothetical protein